LKGLNLNSKENVPVTDAVSGVSNGSSGPNGAQKYSKEPLRPSSSNGFWVAMQIVMVVLSCAFYT
jgi:hypothetical protein